MQAFYALLALFVGLVIPLQSAVNNQLKESIGGSTLMASLVSFLCGALLLALLAVASQERWSGLGQIGQAPWWQLTGGAMGALFVFSTTLLAPRIGLTATMTLIICGQVVASLFFDRYGALGLPVRALSLPRLCGVALVIAGVLLVSFGDRLNRA